ncbi:aldehyde dehydrogenase [Holotrichia oblita]|uniref:Aldehyde dehydrogenase n=1 Tax=Holotrichia oblita TaxID=644536 RepID=A0ACB9SMU0_HOLOL|nr:aldehyde dehydrogenase [Holotrichia oblita]
MEESRQESYMSEIDVVQNDLRNLLFNFNEYTKPEYPSKDQTQFIDTPMIYKEPYGVVLIIGAWNYPFLVTVLPIAGAIAAGNCIIIKPSEIAPASAQYISRNIPQYLDKDCYQVYNGGVAETTELLKEKFDYIFFTGSTAIELGGKCPVYIDESVDMELTTKRIIWGNASI